LFNRGGRKAQNRPAGTDKLYVTRNLAGLVENAEQLLRQAVEMQEATDLVVLELPQGGYYLVPGSGSNLASLQTEHGARAGWQIRNSGDAVVVTGRNGNGSCSLEHRRGLHGMATMLRDSPAYLLV
jgi:hypothetical protein